jgi:nitrate/nitrite-specific signal transduction histidine kinase
MIKDAAEELHSVVRWLRPSPMDGPDMAAALTDLAPSLFQGIPFEFHCPEPVVLSDHYAAAQLLQIACQAVNDALKHPGIQRITVSLSRQKEGVALAVTDDGSPPEGMPTAETLADEELLRLRAGAIGATLTISSQPKQGNSILCTLPLAN